LKLIFNTKTLSLFLLFCVHGFVFPPKTFKENEVFVILFQLFSFLWRKPLYANDAAWQEQKGTVEPTNKKDLTLVKTI
jgi:hypothetical protein